MTELEQKMSELAQNLKPQSAKENERLKDINDDLCNELEKCAKLLRSYEHHHLQKGDREKADRNRRRAENCERVLAKARGEL